MPIKFIEFLNDVFEGDQHAIEQLRIFLGAAIIDSCVSRIFRNFDSTTDGPSQNA